MSSEETIPIFPLGLVLLPHMSLPLHIFEERYKIMIGECLEQQKAFGIVYFDGSEINSAGCTAQIVEVLKRYENGEMDILTAGIRRFYMKEIYDTKPYLEAGIIYFDDQPETDLEELAVLAHQGITHLNELGEITGETKDFDDAEVFNAKKVSFLISGIDGFTPAEKQRLLEMTSTRKRLESGIQSLQKVIQRETLTQDIQNIISGNGNIKKILKVRDSD